MAKLTRKLWVGIGAATIAGAAVTGNVSAQHGSHKQDAGPQSPAPDGPATKNPAEGGEAYLTDGGPKDTRIRFYRDIELMRGHLLVGRQLIELELWDEALPHFLHPTEELYGADGESTSSCTASRPSTATCRRSPRPSRPSARAPMSRR